jgi:hypothetical protein
MSEQNEMQEALALYLRVVDEAIQDTQRPDGSFVQVCNIGLMQGIVGQSPKPTQIIIQILYQRSNDPGAEGRDTARLHGVWLTAAYLLEHGKYEPSSLMLQRMAPDFYDAAVQRMQEQGL